MQETELTNLMYELLSPKENPERWRLYLELFDKHVLRLKMSNKELEHARVFVDSSKVPEEDKYHMQFIENKQKRIDLVIITSKRFIPIEVKIKGKEDAVDQPNQCRDYWCEAEAYHKDNSLSEPPVLYYLTPQGEFPSWESVGDFGFQDRSTNFIRSDKIDDVAFCSEGFYWIDACEKNPPKDRDSEKNLISVSEEIDKMITRTYSQGLTEEVMRKFFTALDNRFDENFCQKYHLKRGGNKRMEIGDCYTYKRYIDRFFGTAFSWPSICLQCTDVKLDDDKELWLRVGCYNGRYSYLDESLAFCAGFMIFSNEIKEGLYKEPEIKRLLNGRNILPQKIVAEYDKKFNGLVGRTDLHDARGNLIYFTDVDRTLRQFRTQEDIVRAVEHIMIEIKKLLRRFIYG
ncbi:MAG: PD-(D/E)XK nuclease family protein [Selenomonadaceae bacterium]|nr:PD-(D/E)XK nuclease family protein [Selenomonadaceae bacterium]